VYLTFDVGTSSVKTALFDHNGIMLRKVVREYPLSTPSVGWCEVHPDVYWNAVREGFTEILRSADIDSAQIQSISGCSQGETTIFLDQQGQPMCPAIVWLDTRSNAESDFLAREIDPNIFYATTGIVEMRPVWSCSKMLWLKRNHPQVFTRARHVLLVEDFIIFRLTGRSVAVPSLWATTGLVDVNSGTWWPEMLGLLGIEGKLPELVPELSVVGAVLPQVANGIGLPLACVVIKGSMDQTMGAVGALNVAPGITTEITGSALVLAVSACSKDVQTGLGLPFLPHVVSGTRIIMPFIKTAGIAYKWFATKLCGYEETELDWAYEDLNRLAATVPPASEGLIVLPFFTGVDFPDPIPGATGVFHGLTLGHGRPHMARAIQESIAYLLRDIVETIEAAGIPVDDIHSMGGAARSAEWLQIKASVTGKPIIRMTEEESSSLGAAICAATALGDHSDIASAGKAMVRDGGRFEPIQNDKALYEKAFCKFKSLRSNLFEAGNQIGD